MTPYFKRALFILAFTASLGFIAKAAMSEPIDPPLTLETESLISRVPRSTGEWHRFATLHEAALYDANRLEECSHYYECSGSIVIDPQGRFVTGPVRTDYIADGVRITHSNVPSDWKVAADIHSHPCVPHHAPAFFSEADMIGSLTTRTTMYMVDLCSGDVHEFIPGKSRVDESLVAEVWLSAGNLIGHVAAFPREPLAKEGI